MCFVNNLMNSSKVFKCSKVSKKNFVSVDRVSNVQGLPQEPVAKTPCSPVQGPEFYPYLGNQIPHAVTERCHTPN